jgi:hypothetical protein
MDRRGLWRPNEEFDLRKPNFTFLDQHNVPVDKTLLAREFPQGISPHGQEYLLDNAVGDGTNIKALRSTLMELIWELVRREDYPNIPSVSHAFSGAKRQSKSNRLAKNMAGQLGQSIKSSPPNTIDVIWAGSRGHLQSLSSGATPTITGRVFLLKGPFWEYLIPLPVKKFFPSWTGRHSRPKQSANSMPLIRRRETSSPRSTRSTANDFSARISETIPRLIQEFSQTNILRYDLADLDGQRMYRWGI